MELRTWLGATAAVALLAVAPSAARANSLVTADLVADCDGFSVTVSAALAFNYQGFLDYSIDVNPAIPGSPIVRSVAIAGDTANTIITRTETVAWPSPLTGIVDVSGLVGLRDTASQLAFNGGIPTTLVCNPDRPAIDLEKEISVDGGVTWFDADDAGSAPSAEAPHAALYRLIVTNTGNVALVDVLVNDASLGLIGIAVSDLAVAESVVLTSTTPGFEALAVADRCAQAGTVVNVSDVSALSATSNPESPDAVSDSDPALLICTERPQGGEGCTPGYWKQSQHFDSWSTYATTDSYNTVFGVTASFDKTLLGALKQGGGGEKALGRHAAAALLNAASGGVSYEFTVNEVIAIVQTAYSSGNFERAKDELASENESSCPLN